MKIKENSIQSFDWTIAEAYDKQVKGVANPMLFEKYGAKVWNHSAQAEELYMAYEKSQFSGSKEAEVGKCLRITSILAVNEKEMLVSLEGMIDATIHLEKEKVFFKSIGMTKATFLEWITGVDGAKESFLAGNGRYVVVENILPHVMVSLTGGHIESLREEFYKEIKKPTSAYIAKVISRNGGGFLVNVNGLNGFLPGSLAAANIVKNFDDLLGQEVYVMVEDYLANVGTFVFSHKKYLSHIMPSKMAELSLTESYTGNVTGVAKFGVFVEFNDIFTGLIHTSKMSARMRDDFKSGEFSAGMPVTFWIKEISADNKIILTDEDPAIRNREIEDFKEKNLGIITSGEVVSIQSFGALIKLQRDMVGLISQKEIKSKKKAYTVGDSIMVNVERVHNDKIFLTIPNEN